MNFKITDEEYAVLCEICKNKRTSPDRLCMMFYDATEPALMNLEKYFLISHETSAGRRYYYATNAGMEYRHKGNSTEKPEQSDPKSKLSDHNHKPTPFSRIKKWLMTFIKENGGILTALASIGTIILFIKSCSK